ncbi:ATP synthase subunit e-like protein [Hapsidospora chrysogenum ATCC 11550]|uniref:ATP synthase F(0) complex subunit e, mitochondrial n=1 Tax=Hapsidospora chrysogenum (strain ATCC 11550 / CBS 779.69 / DSM 880 / IAM 14645 / JCM 23072 / IMI 49137) TaxID=857340 RepID=A0A086THV5_HAPC1|nr:ATP synthase subunit e-like protein [Hapsidospora chrysogenum ATCC 11550]
MSSTGVNVLRWSALAFGVFYGFSHQRKITASQKAEHDQQEWDRKQKIIEKAKAEFAKKKAPPAASSDNAFMDPESPQFDLEKLLLKVAEEKA